MSDEPQTSTGNVDVKALEIAATLANRVDPVGKGGVVRYMTKEEAHAHAALIHELFTIITEGKTPDLAESFGSLKPL
jgi:hypothetical protein